MHFAKVVEGKPVILIVSTVLKIIARAVINVSSMTMKAATVVIVCSVMDVLVEMNATVAGDLIIYLLAQKVLYH